MDIMLIILMIALGIFFIFVSQYLLEKNGMINIYLIYNIISFFLAFKVLEIMKIDVNANIVLSSLFTSLTYLIIEKTNAKEYKNIIKQTFLSNIIMSIFTLISTLYIGSINDANFVNMNNVFLDNYKILISFPLVTLINQVVVIYIYNLLKDIINKISVRIILTNLTVLMIESILFCLLSYIFNVSFINLFILIISNYLIKVIITSIYTPFIDYLIKLKKVKL